MYFIEVKQYTPKIRGGSTYTRTIVRIGTTYVDGSYIELLYSLDRQLIYTVAASSEHVDRIDLVAMAQERIVENIAGLLLRRSRPLADLLLLPPQVLILLRISQHERVDAEGQATDFRAHP